MVFDRRLLWTGVALTAATAISLILVNIPEVEESLPLQETVSGVEQEQEPIPAEEAGPDYAYLVREYQGRIGVYTPDGQEPELVLDQMVRFLPDYDRALLEEGIPVADYAALVALIEDYIS